MKKATQNIDWQIIRSQFPIVNNYTYLNTASSGGMSVDTVKAVTGFYEDELQNAAINRPAWLNSIQEARELAGKMIGTSSENIGFTSDVSQAMNLVADRFDVNTKVVLINGDFPSVNLPWTTKGFKVELVEQEEDHSISIDKISDALGEGNKVLALSWVQYSSGFTIDLELLSKLCKEKNSILIVDGTQGVGCLPINVDHNKIDVLIASSFKWQGAGYGVCLYYENPETKFHDFISSSGWNSLINFSGEYSRENLKNNARAVELGHAKYASVIALQNSLSQMDKIGFDNIYERNQLLRSMLIDELKEQNVVFHSPENQNNQSPIVCIKANEKLFKSMDETGIKTTMREDYIRLSLHYYNDENDINNLITHYRKHSLNA